MPTAQTVGDPYAERMSRSLVALAAVPLLVLLAACGTTPPPVAQSPAPSVTTESPAPEPPAEPSLVNANDYLLDGGEDTANSDGEWAARYGFFTDDAKNVFCDFVIFSGDTPSLSCSPTEGSESFITYPSPVTSDFTCDGSTDIWSDGTELSLGGKGGPAAGWSGCASDENFNAQFDGVRKVLPPLSILEVEPFTCQVTDAIATCAMTDGSASITYGLAEASYTIS